MPGFVGWRLTCPVPLQPATGVGDRAVLLGEAGRGQAEHGGLDLGRIHIVEFAVVLPERGGFGLQRIDHHQVFQLGQALAHLARGGGRGNHVEALDEVAVGLALGHLLDKGHHVVAAIPLGQPVVAPLVLGGGVLSPHALEEADHELGGVFPEVHLVVHQGLGGALFQVIAQALLILVGQRQVAGQHGGQHAQVGEALHVGVTAQGVDAAAGHADVAEQQLHDGRGADHLRAADVLGPAQRVEDGRRLVRHAGGGQLFADVQEILLGCAADAADHLGRVALDVLLQQVEHTARVPQRVVTQGVAVGAQFIGPGGAIVAALVGVVAAEQPVLEVVVLAHDQRRVGVGGDVLVLNLVVAQQIVGDTKQEGRVGAGADRRIEVGHGGGAVEARVHHHQVGVVFGLGFHGPLEAHRVGFGRVAAHHQDDVGVLDVDPVVGHRAASERWRQAGHRRAVTEAGLVLQVHHAQAAGELDVEDAGLVAGRRRAEETGGGPAIDHLALGVFLDEVGVAVVLHQTGDAIERLVPGNALPLIAARFAHFGVLQALVAVDVVDQTGALRTQRATADRMIRVALDVEDGFLGVPGAVAQAVHQDPATHRAIGAVVAGFPGAQQLVLARLGGLGNAGGEAEGGGGRGGDTDSTKLEELSSAELHYGSPHRAPVRRRGNAGRSCGPTASGFLVFLLPVAYWAAGCCGFSVGAARPGAGL